MLIYSSINQLQLLYFIFIYGIKDRLNLYCAMVINCNFNALQIQNYLNFKPYIFGFVCLVVQFGENHKNIFNYFTENGEYIIKRQKRFSFT